MLFARVGPGRTRAVQRRGYAAELPRVLGPPTSSPSQSDSTSSVLSAGLPNAFEEWWSPKCRCSISLASPGRGLRTSDLVPELIESSTRDVTEAMSPRGNLTRFAFAIFVCLCTALSRYSFRPPLSAASASIVRCSNPLLAGWSTCMASSSSETGTGTFSYEP